MTVGFTDGVLEPTTQLTSPPLIEDSPDSEIQVIRKCVEQLHSLPPGPQARVVRYLSERFT